MITAEDLAQMKERNLGCPQCETGRPHRHAPGSRPMILSPTVERLIAEVERLNKELEACHECLDAEC